MSQYRTSLLLLAIILLGATIITVHLLRQPQLTDQQQIEQVVLEAERVIKTKDLPGASRMISPDYDDGAITRRGVARLVGHAFRRPDQYNILEVIRDEQISGDTATLHLKVDFWVVRQTPDVKHLEITLDLRKTDGRWLITRAIGWQEAAEGMEEWGEL